MYVSVDTRDEFINRYTCPFCGANRGQPCQSVQGVFPGEPVDYLHKDRLSKHQD